MADIIDTINELFDQMYNDITLIYHDDNKNVKELYIYLMKKKHAVLCASASNPMNTQDVLNQLTTKQYVLKSS